MYKYDNFYNVYSNVNKSSSEPIKAIYYGDESVVCDVLCINLLTIV